MYLCSKSFQTETKNMCILKPLYAGKKKINQILDDLYENTNTNKKHDQDL